MALNTMTQDYGQWQLAEDGPLGQKRFKLNWFHAPLLGGPPQMRMWELYWEPGRPQICYYRNPNFAFAGGPEFPFACRSPYDPMYNVGDQFFINININVNNFGATNSVPPPSVGGGGINIPQQPPTPPSNGNQPSVPVQTPPNGSSNPNLTIKGALFDLFLTHDQVQTIVATGSVAASVVDVPPIAAAIVAASAILQEVDAAGGNQGVDISGVIGTSAILVTPHGTVTIFDVVNIVQGVAQIIGDQTNPSLVSAINQVKNDIGSAGNAIDQGVNEFNNFLNQATGGSGVTIPPLPPIPHFPPILPGPPIKLPDPSDLGSVF